jgi:hypothetical protein
VFAFSNPAFLSEAASILLAVFLYLIKKKARQ